MFTEVNQVVKKLIFLNICSSHFRILKTDFDDKKRAASTLEMVAVMKIARWSASACAAALALALSFGVTNAQQPKAPEAVTKTAPAKKAATAKKATAAKKAAPAKKAKVKKA
ncbi:MAG: hypothetical protein AB7O71_16285, partial [Hyphomicrobiaceae bacterium]